MILCLETHTFSNIRYYIDIYRYALKIENIHTLILVQTNFGHKDLGSVLLDCLPVPGDSKQDILAVSFILKTSDELLHPLLCAVV